MADETTIQGLALEFANEIGGRLRTVFGPGVPPLQLLVRPSKDPVSTRVVVTHPTDVKGIDLKIDNRTVFRLAINYRCTYDSSERYPRVEESQFQVFSVTSAEPLFRYDYVRETRSEIACAHLNIHGHHDHVVWAMTQAGTQGRRGKRRARSVANGNVPSLRELHFPLGGHRYRPCLEDVLEMLIVEFGLDAEPAWRDELAAGRTMWRRAQLIGAMRDDPETALRVAQELQEGQPARMDRLGQL